MTVAAFPAPSRKPVLEVRDVRIAYGRVEAVRDVSLTIREGEIVAIIGPNGAGKTTLLAGLMGLLPLSGTMAVFGETLADGPEVGALVRRGVALIPEKRELFTSLSVEDNLRLGAFDRYRRGDRTLAASLSEIYALFPRLHERREQAAGTLSGGERQMLAMGRALMSAPKLLMLDEPSLGLAPLVTRDILATVARLRDRGLSCLLVEQNARAALAIADTACVMESGRFVATGPARDIASDPRVIQTYLGTRSGG
ncbi:ABC transporter ATP-binding protein [Methylobacterium nonmethylotrophicum]|uniref:ABC transporter ATP-binding protein n=1 Tax=Methylobacterium nonmethylotrophicum TaxID=1141884 RepID=A0A4Z0NE30_9HYPH|nr:ABC transporter ATP-binding protein [Methylobacterium nonmethylotrophicum]TGD94280.1 ABC transporter ATP-binding protein [Methylobacterium nonmethylotrophicum]